MKKVNILYKNKFRSSTQGFWNWDVYRWRCWFVEWAPLRNRELTCYSFVGLPVWLKPIGQHRPSLKGWTGSEQRDVPLCFVVRLWYPKVTNKKDELQQCVRSEKKTGKITSCTWWWCKSSTTKFNLAWSVELIAINDSDRLEDETCESFNSLRPSFKSDIVAPYVAKEDFKESNSLPMLSIWGASFKLSLILLTSLVTANICVRKSSITLEWFCIML